MKFPVYYITHGGGPCFFMRWNPQDTWDKLKHWLEELPKSLPAKPKAIIIISGHWEESKFTVSTAEKPALIYDYYGFPPHTYELEYKAPGDAKLAEEIYEQLNHARLEAGKDAQRGYDHGVFIPLKVIFPEADIPVVQVSMKNNLNPEQHIELGKALERFREEGCLIIGSGSSYHNLGEWFKKGSAANVSSYEFDSWMTEAVESKNADTRNQKLAGWASAPSARAAHPREEHLIPLMVAAGAAGEDIGKCDFTDEIMGAKISAYKFG